MSQSPRWYRVMAWLSAVVWLTGVWILTSLPIITAPGAMAALHDGGRQLAQGEIPGWARYREVLSDKWRHAWLVASVLLMPCAVTAALLIVAAQQGAPVLAGAALALGVVAGMVNAVGWYVFAITDGPVRSVLHRTLAALLLRPISAATMSIPWWLGAVAVVTAPTRVVVVVVLVAVPVSAALASVIASSHRAFASCRTPRQRVIARVLEPTIRHWSSPPLSTAANDGVIT